MVDSPKIRGPLIRRVPYSAANCENNLNCICEETHYCFCSSTGKKFEAKKWKTCARVLLAEDKIYLLTLGYPCIIGQTFWKIIRLVNILNGPVALFNFHFEILLYYFLRWRNGVQRYLGEDISTLLKSTAINWFGDLIIIYFSLNYNYQWYLRSPVQYERSFNFMFYFLEPQQESLWQSGQFILNFFIPRRKPERTKRKKINKHRNDALLLQKTPSSGVKTSVF